MTATDPRRAIPSVSALLESDGVRALLEHAPRALVVDAVREVLDEARRAASPPGDWAEAVDAALGRRLQSSLRRVFNATGVVLHTNLGRAPLAPAAIDAIRDIAAGYSNLEYDIASGERGSRYVHCVSLLRELTGAEQALVVNNCAGALVLALNTLANGRDAVVSRGELVEIGGSFRVPDIMSRSGARLVEVGTTNRTHVDDYQRALTPDTGAIVKVHRSNFSLTGFVAEASLAELVRLGEAGGVPVIQDFGSGLLVSLEPFGLRGEPTAGDLVATGALVLMSGDKLLGGPQAGIILGARAIVDRLAQNPLTRALRVDKLTLAALEATLSLYRDQPRAMREIPVLAMLTASPEAIRLRCATMVASLIAAGLGAELVASDSSVGGGAFPSATLPSHAVALVGDATAQERALRAGTAPVVGRIRDGRLLLDLRSVPQRDDLALTAAIAGALR